MSLPLTLLDHTGLRASRLSLGTMTFGQPDWGCGEETARELLDVYLAHGGNVVDTADVYAGGDAERIVGRYLADREARDQVVLTSKCTPGTASRRPQLWWQFTDCAAPCA